ncbi:MAG: hypothetical protein KGL40_08865 [Rhodocyclaceae bacterium]|nr:hypothetical protein [Rhodocyclaceae bacterium]
MAGSVVVHGLVAKRSELLSQMEHYVQEVDRLDAEIKHLDATIKLFAPETDLRTLPVKRFVESNHVFRHAEGIRLVLEVMREAGGKLNTQQIAQRVSEKKGLDASKIKVVRGAILDTLKRAEKKGQVCQIGKEGMALLWELA